MIGIGTDIVEIKRIEQTLERLGDRFVDRVLCESEKQELQNNSQPARFLAKRFAAKEAAAKALGTGIGRGVSFQHMLIEHDDMGRPLLRFSDGAKDRAEQLGVRVSLISIADEQDYAVAFVTLS